MEREKKQRESVQRGRGEGDDGEGKEDDEVEEGGGDGDSRDYRNNESSTFESFRGEARDGGEEGSRHLEKAEKVKDAVGERRKKGRKVELELNPPAESSLPSSRLASVLLNLQPLPAPPKRTSISISSTRMSGPPEPEGKLLSEALA